jgi:capsular polysaccharide biosynthesis protein
MDERTFVDWVRLLRDGWVALAVFVMAGAGAGVLATSLQPTEYRSTGTVVVSPASGFLDPSGISALPAITDTVVRLLDTTALLERTRSAYLSAATNARRPLRVRETTELNWLRDHLRAGQVAESGLISVSGTASTAIDARDLTGAAVRSLVQTIQQSQPRGSTTGIDARVFSAAESEGRVSPTPRRNSLIGLNAGLILGVVAALGVGAARRRIRRPEEVAAALGVPLLAYIRAPSRRERHVDPGMVEAEARLRSLAPINKGDTLLVTGPLAAEETAQVSEWIARSIAAGGARAALVDADLSGAAVSQLMKGVGRPGVAETANDARRDLIWVPREDPRAAGSRLSIVGARRAKTEPVRVLTLSALDGDVHSLREQHDAIVIAGPGLDRAAEIVSLLRTTDRVVVAAVRGEKASRLEDAKAFLSRRVDQEKLEGAIVVDPRRFTR